MKDLLEYLQPRRVLDPMAGSGTVADVCRKLGIECVATDLKSGTDARAPPEGPFDLVFLHPPYWNCQRYSEDPRDLSLAPTYSLFLDGLSRVINACTKRLDPGGHLVLLLGDRRLRGSYYFIAGDIHARMPPELKLKAVLIKEQHHARSNFYSYSGRFIPIRHEYVMVYRNSPPEIGLRRRNTLDRETTVSASARSQC